MNKNQIESLNDKREKLNEIKIKLERALDSFYEESKKNNLSCDHKNPDGSLAGGYNGNAYLCKICHCGADFDTLSISESKKKGIL